LFHRAAFAFEQRATFNRLFAFGRPGPAACVRSPSSGAAMAETAAATCRPRQVFENEKVAFPPALRAYQESFRAHRIE
jgi:hypothetical protein